MQIDKRQKRMLYVLGVVLCYAAFELITNSEQYFGYYMDGGNKSKTQQTVIQASVAAPESKKIGINQYDKEWSEDPFFIKEEKKAVKKRKSRPAVKLNLTAISFGGGQPVAMINDEILSPGDKIAGYTVKSIEPKSVILTKGNDRRVLKLE
jgi:hypothetical protein